ncbi:MAG TPA: hypothetical protein VES68_00665 [Candidatus Sulfotelmatobacter sp.]|nr:hypothetical protein [Candidatus Sulfotelmatobacter sp.]
MSKPEQQPNALPQTIDPVFPKTERGKFSRELFSQYKELIDKKFPLVQSEAMGETEFINEALLDGDVINFLYLPRDEKRKDPEEQIKVSSTKDKTTVIIKNDDQNPEISFQTFDTSSELVPPPMLSYVKNSLESVRRVREMLEKLRTLKGFDLVYPPKAA